MVGYFLKKQSLLLKGASSILLLVVLFWPVWGNAQDTMNAPLPVPDEAMDTFLLMLALCAIFLMGFIFVVTVALIFITVLILLGMIAAGIVSSAVFVGMYNTDWTNNIVQYRLSPNCTICLIPSAFTPESIRDKIYKILAYYINHIGIKNHGLPDSKLHGTAWLFCWLVSPVWRALVSYHTCLTCMLRNQLF